MDCNLYITRFSEIFSRTVSRKINTLTLGQFFDIKTLEELQKFLNFLKNNQNIKKLEFLNYELSIVKDLSKEIFIFYQEMFAFTKKIKVVCASKFPEGNIECIIFSCIIIRSENLTINFSDNILPDMLKLLNNKNSLYTLLKLNTSQIKSIYLNIFQDNDFNVFNGNDLVKFLEYFPNIKSLTLGNLKIKENLSTLLESCSKFALLERFETNLNSIKTLDEHYFILTLMKKLNANLVVVPSNRTILRSTAIDANIMNLMKLTSGLVTYQGLNFEAKLSFIVINNLKSLRDGCFVEYASKLFEDNKALSVCKEFKDNVEKYISNISDKESQAFVQHSNLVCHKLKLFKIASQEFLPEEIWNIIYNFSLSKDTISKETYKRYKNEGSLLSIYNMLSKINIIQLDAENKLSFNLSSKQSKKAFNSLNEQVKYDFYINHSLFSTENLYKLCINLQELRQIEIVPNELAKKIQKIINELNIDSLYDNKNSTQIKFPILKTNKNKDKCLIM